MSRKRKNQSPSSLRNVERWKFQQRMVRRTVADEIMRLEQAEKWKRRKA